MIGSRIVVTGMAGAGKSTLSKVLSTKTSLPLIHLDLHRWQPGWTLVTQEKFLAKQNQLLAADQWIVDSNDVNTQLLIERADTLVVLDTPWWLCAWRAFRRGLRRPPDTQLPEGCDESFSHRIGDEWGIVWRNWRDRKSIRAQELAVASRCQSLMQVHILSSKQKVAAFVDLI